MFELIANGRIAGGSVDRATGYRLDTHSSIPSKGKIFQVSTTSGPAQETSKSLIQGVNVVLSEGMKQSEPEADNSPPSNDMV
jgi:hypothetical protein